MNILEISKSSSAKTEFSVFFRGFSVFFNTDVGVGFLKYRDIGFGYRLGSSVCVCVWSWPLPRKSLLFFVQQRPNFKWYPRPFESQRIYARLQKIASNFSKFSRYAPHTPRRRSRLRLSVRGFALLTGSPFPKFLDPPLSRVSCRSSLNKQILN